MHTTFTNIRHILSNVNVTTKKSDDVRENKMTLIIPVRHTQGRYHQVIQLIDLQIKYNQNMGSFQLTSK